MKKIKAYGIVLYKVEEDVIKILLCKSVKSLNKWGCLKGMLINSESTKECAKREFYEECNIDVNTSLFEEYFSQKNKEKDVGVWIVNSNKIKDLDKCFLNDKLFDYYLSWENSKVKFFDINKLPQIKKKQTSIVSDIKDFIQNKSLSH